MEHPVELALVIALTGVLVFLLIVGIVLFCTYRKPINEAFKTLEFDNEEHEAKKLAKLNEEKSGQADKDIIDKN